MSSILLTGATGQIGRWTLHQLLQRDPSRTVVLGLRQPDAQLPRIRAWLAQRGIQADARPALRALPYELDSADSARALLQATRPALVLHLAARLAWGLSPDAARRAQVDAGLALLDATAMHAPQARLVQIAGYMTRQSGLLRSLGLDLSDPGTDWPRLYRRVGAYEASKLQAYAALRARAAATGQRLISVHPATVAGHSVEGELPAHAALYGLCRQLLRGRLQVLPGTSAHRLPLVAVDHVAGFLARLSEDTQVDGGDYLLHDAATPPLHVLVQQLAQAMARRAPRLALPLPLMRLLLRLPGIAAFSGAHAESLGFILGPDAELDTGSADALARRWGLRHPPMETVLRASARHVQARETGSGR